MTTTYCRACEASEPDALWEDLCPRCVALPHFERTLLTHLAVIGSMLTGICMHLDPNEDHDPDDVRVPYTLIDDLDA